MQIKCGAPTGFIGVNIVVKKDGVNFYAPQTPVMASQATFTTPALVPGNYTYECLEYYDVPTPPGNVSCGGSFSLGGDCEALAVNIPNPTTQPLVANYDCDTNPASPTTIKVFKVQNSQLITTINNSNGQYTLPEPNVAYRFECLAQGETVADAECKKTVTGVPPVVPTCTSLTINSPANNSPAPQNINYTCVGTNSSDYVVTLTAPGFQTQTLNGATNTFNNIPA